MSGFAQRFAVEAAFLVLLALATGFADLEAWQIAATMAVGWVLVALIEYLAWRGEHQLAERIEAVTAAPSAEAEERHGWDVEEILAPMPEDTEDEAYTSVIPPDEQT